MAKNEAATDETTGTEPAAPEGRKRTLAEITGAMGAKLETVKGEKVTVVKIAFDTREVHKLDERGNQMDELETKEVAFLWLDSEAPENMFYTFSEPLINKLKTVTEADLPAEATFDIKDISGGRRVWTIS